MHIFLQGPLGIGKSTVIRKALAILSEPLAIGGFFTYKLDDDGIYICATDDLDRSGAACVARFGDRGSKNLYPEIFDTEGVRLLQSARSADLIIMDELGFLESKAELFKQEVLACIDRDTPILGVLRDMEIPWHKPIKSHPSVKIIRVTEENRNNLAEQIREIIEN